MTDPLNKPLEPVPVEKLFADFADFTIAELILEIKEGRAALEIEKKALANSDFHRTKAEMECEDLKAKILAAEMALSGTETEEIE